MARDGGQPGVPHTNAIIERCNQLVSGGTSTCLIAAGLPPCYWTYASPCFCFVVNTKSLHGISPWGKTHGTPFLHQRYPFGCLVIVKPEEVRTTDHKWAPKAEWGVFAGYQFHSGYNWKGEYLVWRFSEFNVEISWSMPPSTNNEELRHRTPPSVLCYRKGTCSFL